MSRQWQHDVVHFSGVVNVPWFSFLGRIISGQTINPGEIVVPFPPLSATATAIPIRRFGAVGYASTDFTRGALVGVASTTIRTGSYPGNEGVIYMAGYVPQIAVTGTVAIGDWLRPSGTYLGVAVAAAPASDGLRFAVADEAHSGASSTIRGWLLMGRP